MIDGQVTVPQASGTGQKARPNGAGNDKDGVCSCTERRYAISHKEDIFFVTHGTEAQWVLCRQQDAEKDKLRSALGSAIMVETPNIKVLAMRC